MLHIKLIAFGKLKESYLREACEEYEKRLWGYCKLDIWELRPAPLPENPSPAQIAQALRLEAAAALAQTVRGSSVALCPEGSQMTSEAFSAWLAKQESPVSFYVGSSFGMDDMLKSGASLRLSLSPMTFPHQLARVMLLEQLYRAFQIASGGKYHK